MVENELKLVGGALVIGSLLWQDDWQDGDKVRKTWRDDSLEIASKAMVRSPIRYGRQSKGSVFTMTFSNSLRRKMGSAFVIPFQKKGLSIDEIIVEGRKMALTEGMREKFVADSQHDGTWAVMGILFNPKWKGSSVKRSVVRRWKSELENEFDCNDFKIGRERCSIRENGELCIPWPITIDGRDNQVVQTLDFIVASSTKPTHYPSNSELIRAVRQDSKRYYFLENFKRGITTFQDNSIINHL